MNDAVENMTTAELYDECNRIADAWDAHKLRGAAIQEASDAAANEVKRRFGPPERREPRIESGYLFWLTPFGNIERRAISEMESAT